MHRRECDALGARCAERADGRIESEADVAGGGGAFLEDRGAPWCSGEPVSR